ncbi:glycosyltransferase [Lacinutrix sp. MEBiC02595]
MVLKDVPKHIAIVVNYFPTVSETFIVNQINSLLDAGFKISLYAYHQVDLSIIHDSFTRHDLLNTVTYFVKPPTSKVARFTAFATWSLQNFKSIKWALFFKALNVFKYGKDAYTLKLFFEAQWFLVNNKTDLIHAHFGMVGNRLAYVKAKEIIPDSVKLITTFHGYDLFPNKLLDYKKEYRYLFEKAHAFTVNTPYLEGLLQQINRNKVPFHILPVGLDTSFFKRTKAKTENGYFDIVFCGKLMLLKGPDLAIAMVRKLHDLGYAKVRLHLIGDGLLKKELKKNIQDLHLQDFVLLYGSQVQGIVKKHLEQADVFLLPGRVDPETGRAETQGLVIQEAQAMELPVVVSNVGGMPYGLLPNKSGFVVEEGDVDGFATVIEKLILDIDFRKQMGETGRDFVVHNYDNKVLVTKLQEIYNSIN